MSARVCKVFANGDCAAVNDCADSGPAEWRLYGLKSSVVCLAVYLGKPVIAALPFCYLTHLKHNY